MSFEPIKPIKPESKVAKRDADQDGNEYALFDQSRFAQQFGVDAEIEILGIESNCGDVKDRVKGNKRFARFGSCKHPLPPAAEAEAYATLLPLLLLDGATRDVTVGHATVRNRLRIKTPLGDVVTDLPNTYLAYAVGN